MELFERVRNYYLDEDYLKIVGLKNEITKDIDEDKLDIYNMLFKSLFYIEEYDDVIILYNKLIKYEIESYEGIYYTLLSCIANDDIFLGLSIIKKSILLNNEEIKCYREIDGANYINLLKENEDIEKALIVTLFVENHFNKCDELAVGYFENVGSLYEMGYSIEIVKELTTVGHMIFKI